MIFDCFLFFNELDLLKIRLHTLNPIVDYFVLTESTVTFSGDPKPLYYSENRKLFSEFEHKIIYNLVTDTPTGGGVTAFDRDGFQKAARSRGLANCNPEDIIIYSDLDEIPNPVAIKKIIPCFNRDVVYQFAQRQFYFYLNNEEVSGNLLSYAGEYEGVKEKKWLGSYMFSFGLLGQRNSHDLRVDKSESGSVRVDQGGWHFTYMGGDAKKVVDRVAHKIRSAAHQEFNNAKILSKLEKRIKSGKDIFGRKAKFKLVDLDNTFPRYLLENLYQFEHLIMPRKKDNIFPKIKIFIFGK